MKVLKWLLLTAVGIVVALGIVGLFLPRTSHVERSVAIDASPGDIYGVISDMRRFNDWSPWARLDPASKYEYAGSGVGSSISWASDDPSVGSGTMTITALRPDERVDLGLDFGEADTATSYLALAADEGATNVTWGFDTDLGANPYYRYFGLLLDTMVGNSYEEGLGNLKTLMEKT